MKKHIYLSMALLASASLALASGVLCLIFYHQFSSYLQSDVKRRTQLLKDALAGSNAARTAQFDAQEIASNRLFSALADDMRISIVSPDGIVLYDNTIAAETLENHRDREEIRAARNAGFGESRRFSSSLQQETYYYAVELPNGWILRAARTTGSFFTLFGRALPAVFGVVICAIIICYIAAGSLTDRIVKPLNAARLDGDITAPYDELIPFVRAIEKQRGQIAGQLASLQERSNAINAIMENMSEGAALLDRRGIILSANKSVLRIFGVDAPMEGKNILELLRDITLLEYTRNALTGSRGETDMERAGREYRVYFSPVTDNGAILLFLDVTEKSKAEKLRREFSATVSHELKTPLTSISGYAELLDSGMVQEGDKAAFIRKIKDESWRLLSLIEDIMLLSRLDEGENRSSPFAAVNLAAAAKESAAALTQKASELGVSITVKADDDAANSEDTIVNANPSMMAELFFNLIDNAIKYNKPGGSVTVEVAESDGLVAASVSDTGLGIPKEAQSRVFERFYRVDKSRSKKTGGTGLGLAIVKHITAAHNAEITLDSREGEGTKITVYFKRPSDRSKDAAANNAG
ncbi:MAG: PAS domain-containing protein [Treponema sp.]|jgi:two-component system phosphate regulon sensor histidine kinase PhoR|nr:PAS domain-containing protein [Treponema sp.]